MGSYLRLVPGDAEPVASTPSPIRVVLADDHVVMRRSLRELLDGEENLVVVGEADSLESVAREVRVGRPHVLALDLGMHDGSTAIEAVRTLRERAPKTMIVGLTMQDDPAFAQHALTAGAVGVVSKELADAELAQAIRDAARGEQFLSRRIAERLAARRQASAEGRRYDTASQTSEDSA